MSDRRMMTKKVTDDDSFMALSSSAQALYLHLTMSADDDGFSNQVSVSMFKAHASVQDLEALLEKRYILQFEDGVIVIKHWRMANSLRKDRYTPTAFKEDLKRLSLDDNVYEWLPDGCQMVAKRLPQYNLTKDNQKEKGVTNVTQKKNFVPPTVEEVRQYCTERNSNVDPESFVDFYSSKGWMVGKNHMKDWRAAVRTWERHDGKKGKTVTVSMDWKEDDWLK